MHEVVLLFRSCFYEENNKDILMTKHVTFVLQNVLVNNFFLCSESSTLDTKLCGKCPS